MDSRHATSAAEATTPIRPTGLGARAVLVASTTTFMETGTATRARPASTRAATAKPHAGPVRTVASLAGPALCRAPGAAPEPTHMVTAGLASAARQDDTTQAGTATEAVSTADRARTRTKPGRAAARPVQEASTSLRMAGRAATRRRLASTLLMEAEPLSPVQQARSKPGLDIVRATTAALASTKTRRDRAAAAGARLVTPLAGPPRAALDAPRVVTRQRAGAAAAAARLAPCPTALEPCADVGRASTTTAATAGATAAPAAVTKTPLSTPARHARLAQVARPLRPALLPAAVAAASTGRAAAVCLASLASTRTSPCTPTQHASSVARAPLHGLAPRTAPVHQASTGTRLVATASRARPEGTWGTGSIASPRAAPVAAA